MAWDVFSFIVTAAFAISGAIVGLFVGLGIFTGDSLVFHWKLPLQKIYL